MVVETMIGQVELQTRLYTLVQANIFPRFAIFIGNKGSGRKTLALSIAEQLGAVPVISELGIDSVRTIIKSSYTNSEKCCYIFPDADNMSIGAKNSLLKITEEVPNNAYIIMTLEDKANTLRTILSRATIFDMSPYARDELEQFIEAGDEKQLLLDLATTPGDIYKLKEIGVVEFNDYVKKVYDNIAEVSGANSFKIANKVALKEDAEGYPMDLFFKIFVKHCMQDMMTIYEDYGDRIDSINRNSYAIKVTSEALEDLRLKGINKKMLMDMWILKIREGWM